MINFCKAMKLFSNPSLILKPLIRYLPGLPLQLRVDCDAIGVGPYAYGMHKSALQAKALGLQAVSVIEFGVAGGNGLVAMETIAEAIEHELGVNISIYGFDIVEGLPRALDYRDLPYAWQMGAYKMDEEKLRKKLKRSALVLGDVKETVSTFLDDVGIPPIGFISFDLDYYSSTKAAFQILEENISRYLPRVMCYFDDILGMDDEYHCEFVGEMLSIEEFNKEHENVKIGRVNGFSFKRIFPDKWNEGIRVCHFFEHPLYNRYVSRMPQELPLH